jgi:hypothetical protein
MVDTANSEKHVFSLGDPNVAARCPKTGRLFEVGAGAWTHEQQSANYVREAARAADMPKDGEQCSVTHRFYEVSSGALTKTQQSALFVREASPEQARRDDERATAVAAAAEVQRLAKVEADALAAMIPAGSS